MRQRRIVFMSAQKSHDWNLQPIFGRVNAEAKIWNAMWDQLVPSDLIVVAAYGWAGRIASELPNPVVAISHGVVTFSGAPGEDWIDHPPSRPLELLVASPWTGMQLRRRGWEFKSQLHASQPTFEAALLAGGARESQRPLKSRGAVDDLARRLVHLDQPGCVEAQHAAIDLARQAAAILDLDFEVVSHHTAGGGMEHPVDRLTRAAAITSRWSTGLVEAWLARVPAISLSVCRNWLGWASMAMCADEVADYVRTYDWERDEAAVARFAGSRVSGSVTRTCRALETLAGRA